MSQLFNEITSIGSEVRGLRETVESRLSAHTNNLTAQYNALKVEVNKKLEPKTHITLIVDGTIGNDSTADGTEAKPYKTIAAAVAACPIFATGDVTILVKTGTYVTPLVSPEITCRIFSIRGFDEDAVVVWKSASESHALRFVRADAHFFVHQITFVSESGTQVGVAFGDVKGANIDGCTFRGFSHYGVKLSSTNAVVQNCKFENIGNSAIVCDRSLVRSRSNTSIGQVQHGLLADAGIIFKEGVQPSGTTANEKKIWGGQIFG